MLEVKLLGRFEIGVEGRPLEIASRPAQSLLAFLMLNGGNAHRREQLAGLFWPDSNEKNARNNLRQALWRIRQTIGDGYLEADKVSVAFNAEEAYSLDAQILESVAESEVSVDTLEKAVSVYQGELLPGFYESWVSLERERLQAVFEQRIQTLLTLLVEEKRWDEVTNWAERWMSLGNAPEPAYRALMTAAAGRGDKAGVATAFQRCVEMLEKEVGVEPSEETRALYEKILAGEVPPDAEPAGSIEGYELKEEIGSGAHGSVYLAYQRSVGREVAVKSILPQYANNPEFIGRFESEAQRIAHLEHPNIVPLYDFWRGPEGAYLVMRLLRGGTLLSSLADGPWPVERALRMIEQVASALAAAHRQGIIHRDVKASNILLDEEGNAYLSDFGIAKDLTHAGLTAAGALIGTPEYISPEQIRDEDLSPQTDIYSLGVVLYETLTGDKPFTAATLSALLLKQLNDPLPPITNLRPELSRQVDLVIQRATAKRPADRYPNAPAMVKALREAVSGVKSETERVRNGKPAKTGPVRLPQNETSSSPPAFLGDTGEPMAIAMETFIGRESELSQLDQLLAQSIAGKGQMALLTGEAGRGKTSLLNEFARRALDAEPTLIVASGTCSIFTGIGDPYLPFREVLGMLSGDFETKYAAGTISRDNALRLWRFQRHVMQILVERGPNLIDTFVTARALQDRAARYAPDQASLLDDFLKKIDHHSAFSGEQDSDQSRLFEEYWDVLAALAAKQPLLIVLDDLHWADHSSISLLSYLALQVAESPVMLVGAYRPEDVALGREGRRHPLEAVLSELKRRLGNVWVDLDQNAQTLGQTFVDGLLDTEPNQLNEAFRQNLLRHTGGHPLFTVELLRDMQARGRLRKNGAGQWVEGPGLSWQELPARVEGVIETRIGRLDTTQQEILSVASVEGEEFTAEVIAQVLNRDAQELARGLSRDLERQHRLVQEQGIRYIGAQRLSLFRFRHNLFRNYLYDNLGFPERMYLHQAIGNALEELHRDQAEEVAAIAPQLAHHFQEARMVKEAIGYLLLAGERAARSFAYEEAFSHFMRGLALQGELPDSSRHLEQECELLLSLGKMQWKLGKVAEALDTLQRSAGAARQLDSPEALAHTALAYEEPRWRFNLPPDPVVRLLEEALDALREQESALRVRILATLARALMGTGRRAKLTAMVEQAVEMARRIDDQVALYDALRIRVQVDRQPETISARIAASNEMVQLAETVGDRERLVVAYAMRLYDQLELGEVKSAEADYHAHVELGQKIRLVFAMHASEVYGAMWALLRGRFEEAEQLAEQALDVGRRMGSETIHGTFGIQMFSIRREQGRLREVAPVVKHFVSQNPGAAIWRPGLALIYSDLGLEGECRETFEYLAADDFARLPKDALWVTCVAYLAEACAFLEDTERAATLYRLLSPFEGRVVVVGSAVACYGAASRYLGMLATTMRRWEEAERHYVEAVNLNTRLEAWPWLAHTQYQFASMLLARNGDGDYSRANALLEESLATAEELDMQFLVQKARALRVLAVRYS